MSGRIPSAFIDELLNRIDIVEVIDQRLPLKKAGREFQACCPFHNEKTPSFTVSPSKQFYHCFGCGAHGSAIGFLMEYDRLEFVEAVEELARVAGLDIPYETRESPELRHAHQQTQHAQFDLMARCDRYYRQQLRQHPHAQVAVDYLKSRGLSGEIAARFNIGYAPPGWDNLATTLGKANHDQLLTLGMLIKKDAGGVYDRFRQRIMFPIRDSRGRVLGFGGRILPTPEDRAADLGVSTQSAIGGMPLGDTPGNKPKLADTEGPKYLNSPETPLFHKGQELYGLYEARQALRQIDRLLVVEGYMDVVALAQFDIAYCVATLGTATTADHLQRLFRISNEVVFCFDGDRAGRAAAWRALEQTLPTVQEGRTLRFMFLPDGEDPDTLVRKIGKPAFEALITQAQPLSEYFFAALGEQVDLSRFEGRAQLVDLAKPLLTQLPASVYRQMMLEQLALLARQEITGVLPSIGPAVPTTRYSATRPTTRPIPSLVRRALELILYDPSLAQTADPSRLAPLDIPGIPLLVGILETLQKTPNLNTAAVLERWRDTDEGRHLAKLASWQPPPANPDYSLQSEFSGALNRLVAEQHPEARMDFLLAKAKLSPLNPQEKAELKQLLLSKQAPGSV
ncbi:MAG: DNA primase [Gammaproteobacteria bacterium]|nr:DNA primase [Gammaproteobacteria bacterium]